MTNQELNFLLIEAITVSFIDFLSSFVPKIPKYFVVSFTGIPHISVSATSFRAGTSHLFKLRFKPDISEKQIMTDKAWETLVRQLVAIFLFA